eukprot:208335-Prymnesium_polylepis.1
MECDVPLIFARSECFGVGAAAKKRRDQLRRLLNAKPLATGEVTAKQLIEENQLRNLAVPPA